MLLRHTEKKVKERSALTVNPSKTCQPVGAMYAALGIHNCLPHSHGSQGCCAYHRSALTRHYKEPVIAATSSFTEGASVFGGQANLVQGIDNMFTIYDPDVIAIHTTCLSETIGDDIPQIVAKATADGKVPEGKEIIHCNTPSYVGSHVTGFANMVKGIVDYYATPSEEKTSTINIMPGWVEPADMREIKRLCKEMGVDTIMMPDTSGVLDAPLTGKASTFQAGGTTVEELKKCGSSKGTIAMGVTASTPAARALDVKCSLPTEILELPIGLDATDKFIDALRKMGLAEVPESIKYERGRLLDMISDMQQYTYGKKAAIWGDPDQLVSIAEFLTLLNIEVKYVVTGTPGKKFLKRMEKVLGDKYNPEFVKCGLGADMFLMHQWIKEESVDLLIGNTYGKYIARDEDIPFVRHGFPTYDRVGHQYFTTVGYT